MDEKQPLSASQCAIRTTYVQLQIECESLITCAAKKFRPSQLTTNPVANFTWLDFEDAISWFSILFGLTATTTVTLAGLAGSQITLDDMYLIDPDDPTFSRDTTPAYELGKDLYGLRLGQLLNSLGFATIAGDSIMLGLTAGSPNATSRTNPLTANSTNGSLVFESTTIHCNNIWMAFLLIVSMIMIICTFLHAILNFVICHAPDFLNGNISSMLRDNPWVYPRAADSMTYNSAHRAANLAQDAKKLKVMLGDVHDKETVGHLAIGLLGSGYNVAPITKYRSFY